MKRLVILASVLALAGCGSTYAQRRANRENMMLAMSVIGAATGGAAIAMASRPAPVYSAPPPAPVVVHSTPPVSSYMSGGPSVSGDNGRCAWDDGTHGCTVE